MAEILSAPLIVGIGDTAVAGSSSERALAGWQVTAAVLRDARHAAA